MTSDLMSSITLPKDPEEWPSLFRDAHLDCVLDPMVLRAADFFIGGREYCRRMAPHATQNYWPVIDSNFDGVLAFFHILMTRDRIAFLDYWDTYTSEMPSWFDNSIVLNVFGGEVYESIKQKALEKLATAADSLPEGASLDHDRELLELGNFWQPGLGHVSVNQEGQSAARFVLGGWIFGEYANRGHADHLLQSKRLRLMSGFGGPPADPLSDWIAEEKALFEDINKFANRDLSLRSQEVLPNVLLHLLKTQRRHPREYLEEALKIRGSDEGIAYRDLIRRLREAWLRGFEDEKAVAEVRRVAAELSRRISGEPMSFTGISAQGKIEGGIGAKIDLGIVHAHGAISGSLSRPEAPLSLSFPRSIRNWFVDRFVLKGHQKLLLRMALDQRSFTGARRGMHEVWRNA